MFLCLCAFMITVFLLTALSVNYMFFLYVLKIDLKKYFFFVCFKKKKIYNLKKVVSDSERALYDTNKSHLLSQKFLII